MWPPRRDEREAAVDHAADRLAYLVVSYGLLGIAAFRGLVEHTAAWDLLGLVIVGGVVGAAYRLSRHVFFGRWAAWLVVTVVVAAVLAGAIAFARA